MASFGHLAVCLAAVLSAAGGALALGGRGDPRRMDAGRKLLCAAAFISLAAVLGLGFMLLVRDFRAAYVRDYADRTMSDGYLLTAIWGGQQGSLLLWAAIQTWLTALSISIGRWRNTKLLPMAAFPFGRDLR